MGGTISYVSVDAILERAYWEDEFLLHKTHNNDNISQPIDFFYENKELMSCGILKL